MRKPTFDYFYKFKEKFDAAKKRFGKAQLQIIPYFISSHPGSRPEDMADLAVKTKDLGFKLEQVQDFTPTPMTVATEIYATGVHPYNLKPVTVAKTPEEKQEQRSFFFWYKPEMRASLRATLKRLGLDAVAAKLLGGESAKFQMIGESDYAKVKSAAQLGALPPRPVARQWFGAKRRRK
jgi:radical SAM superfamily enzyme YgiQ (UPF0313 family)